MGLGLQGDPAGVDGDGIEGQAGDDDPKSNSLDHWAHDHWAHADLTLGGAGDAGSNQKQDYCEGRAAEVVERGEQLYRLREVAGHEAGQHRGDAEGEDEPWVVDASAALLRRRLGGESFRACPPMLLQQLRTVRRELQGREPLLPPDKDKAVRERGR